MNRIMLMGAAAIIGLGLPACATTQATQTQTASNTQQESTTGQRRNVRGHSKGAFLETYDLNGDGSVTETEFYTARGRGYDARDMNNDSSVSPDEYVGEYEGRLDEQLAEQRDRQLKQAYVRFDILDGDKDGDMTREEFNASGKRMFDRLDTDGNGVVDENDTTEHY